MSVETVKAYLKEKGLLERYLEFPGSSATVALAAEQLDCEPDRIAKTLAIKLIKKLFKETSHFCPASELEDLFGHPMGGVCPFALHEGVEVFLDESLKKYDVVYPAAGSANNAVKIETQLLAEVLKADWINVTK